VVIAIDAKDLCAADSSHGAGIGHYTWAIVLGLVRAAGRKHRFVIAVPSACSARDEQELTAAGNVTVIRGPSKRIPFLSRHLFLPVRLALARPDILFCPSGEAPLFWTGNTVATVHDLAVYEHPEWFEERDRGNLSRRVIFPRTVLRATRLICPSQATERSLNERFPAAQGKTSVVYEGTDARRIERLPSADKDLVLFVGTIEPRKNLTVAVRAFDAYLRRRPERAASTQFVIAGRVGWKADATLDAIREVNDAWRRVVGGDVVRLLGYVTNQEKESLLAKASVFLFPSLEEGFGLPVLEAMAAGIPVVTSERGAIPEVAGDSAMYVDPEDAEAASLALAQCLLMPDATVDFVRAGKQRAALFTWERAAAETLSILQASGTSSASTR
jgi:glycosyltransferase involved in cell wall biosynthesis